MVSINMQSISLSRSWIPACRAGAEKDRIHKNFSQAKKLEGNFNICVEELFVSQNPSLEG